MTGEEGALSLYLHTPFCRSKCAYCHFYSIPTRNSDRFDSFVQGLRQEWELRRTSVADRHLTSIYFGGGTPSLLGPDRIQHILSWIGESLPISAPGIEITLEANPEGVTRELMSGYAQSGINRVSFGVQSLDDDLLRGLGRRHNSRQAVEAIQATAEAGLSNISVDLMYELPGQTLDHWKKTLTQVTALPIQHLSLYNLTLEPNTSFFKRQAELRPRMPDDATSAEMYRQAIDRLPQEGLIQYEISAFAREGHRSRHNVGYWTGRPFLGLGPSAFSYWMGKRSSNVAEVDEWKTLLDRSQLPTDFEEDLDPDARRRELLAIHLRLLSGVNLGQFQHQQGALSPSTQNSLAKLINLGLLVQQEELLALTRQGVFFYDEVASEIV